MQSHAVKVVLINMHSLNWSPGFAGVVNELRFSVSNMDGRLAVVDWLTVSIDQQHIGHLRGSMGRAGSAELFSMGMGRILEADSIQLHLLGIEIQPRHAFDPKPYSSRFIHEKLCIGTLCERHLTEIHVVALPPP